jgi:hypothetical protein
MINRFIETVTYNGTYILLGILFTMMLLMVISDILTKRDKSKDTDLKA